MAPRPGERCVCGKIIPYGGLLDHLDCESNAIADHARIFDPSPGPNDLQLRNARRVWVSFAPTFEEFHHGFANGDVRLVINRFVFCIAADGSCRVEYPSRATAPDLLDSDYDPEAYAGVIDLHRKAERENR